MEVRNNEQENKKPSKKWVVLAVAICFVVVVVAFMSQQATENKSKKKQVPQNEYDRRHRRQNNPGNDKDNDDDDKNQDYSDLNQDFIEKGYSDKDIKQLKDWGFEAGDVPDLKAKKRRGVVNTLAVSGEAEKGSCSQLVILKKKSPHATSKEPKWTKIKQSDHFADTSNTNETIIRFAINKIIKQDYDWKYDVYVLQANDNAVISGSSAGSGVYMAFLSACYSNCAIPKNLAITGTLDTEKKEIPIVQIEPIPKKYQWRADHCAQCDKYSQLYHFIYDKKNGGKLEKSFNNATNPDSQWVFCTQKCYKEWWDENVYNCSECGQQRFGSCSCCGKHQAWIGENNDSNTFCSKKCADKYYPTAHEEGKIGAIGGIGGKITAAVREGCDTIIIPKSNSANYYNQVPLSVQAKVKKLHEVENYEDLRNLFLSGL